LAYYLVKIAITTILIVAISEIAKRSTFVGAILASVPLISVLALVWLYVDTKDVARVSNLSTSIFLVCNSIFDLISGIAFTFETGLKLLPRYQYFDGAYGSLLLGYGVGAHSFGYRALNAVQQAFAVRRQSVSSLCA
jgi:hypothetical protein